MHQKIPVWFATLFLVASVGLTQGIPDMATAAAATPINHQDVERWAAAWNSHDIETVLTLFDPAVSSLKRNIFAEVGFIVEGLGHEQFEGALPA